MILTNDLRTTFERWDIDPNDELEQMMWRSLGNKGQVQAELTTIETTEFLGSDEELFRYLHDIDKQLRADATMLWAWIEDDCITEPPDAPQTRVWDGEAYRLDI